MSNAYLVVVDMQHDFADGALGTPEARAIVPAVAEHARDFAGTVVFTLDTHHENYAGTQEGRNLPVEHCIRGTHGWELVDELEAVRRERGARIFEKPTFGSVELARWLLRGEQCAAGQGLAAGGPRPREPQALRGRHARVARGRHRHDAQLPGGRLGVGRLGRGSGDETDWRHRAQDGLQPISLPSLTLAHAVGITCCWVPVWPQRRRRTNAHRRLLLASRHRRPPAYPVGLTYTVFPNVNRHAKPLQDQNA